MTMRCDNCEAPILGRPIEIHDQADADAPLTFGSWNCVAAYADEEGQLCIGEVLAAAFRLADAAQFNEPWQMWWFSSAHAEAFLDVVSPDEHPARKAAA